MDRDERTRDVTSGLTELRAAEALIYKTLLHRSARVRLPERVPVRLHIRDAHVVDISLSGALLEHTGQVRPGEVYPLFFPVEGRQVQVLARAIRSFVSGLATVAPNTRQVVYRTALEFIQVGTGAAKLFSAYLERPRERARQ